MRYAYTREQAVALLEEHSLNGWNVRTTMVREILLAGPVSEKDIAWAYRKARALKMLPEDLALDPRYAQILALDT